MKKMMTAMLLATVLFTGCGKEEKVNEENPYIKEISVKPITVNPIEVKTIEVETIETETILWENVEIESFD